MSLLDVKNRITVAEKDVGRQIGSTQLIAVSKLQTSHRVESALDLGHRIFGENRVQEAESRWPPLLERYRGISLHLIGPLQTNKAKPAMELFSAIHSVDRPKLLSRIYNLAQQLGRCPRLFIQVNTGEEKSKSGVSPGELDAIVKEARIRKLPVDGLMCIPPTSDEPALHFGLLASLAERNGLKQLSMGMSNDFETAVRMGSNFVRVGSAIFGPRMTR